MAVRLQMKLGVVAEADRLEDSPDTVAVVEPTSGATLRSKGSLYLVVSGLGRTRRLQEATRLVADTIESEYYYDESAGLVACLEKAIRTANRKLAAQRDRLGVGGDGPLGLAAAVVRGNELYVTTAGPAEAYLIRQAHLLTLPDPNVGHGLPADDLIPQVWRGEMAPGDTVVLVSRNVTTATGIDELKDAINRLHPQAAMERLHERFMTAGGSGSDSALAIEATEVAATSQGGRLIPARAPEPLAGAPDRSPIPLADSVEGGVAAVSARASRAKSTVGNAVSGLARRLLNALPQRGPQHRRVTPAATQRESQRRAAVATLAFVGIAAGLGIGLWIVGGPGGGKIDEVTAGEKALAAAKEDLRLVFDNGANLVLDDPKKAEEFLVDAHAKLATAATAGVPATTLSPLQTRVEGGLNDIYGVVNVAPSTAFSFAGQEQPFDLAALVLGPDGAPYVLDRTTKTVYRIDLRAKKATPVARAGASAGGGKVAEPRFIAVGGPDVLALDSKNALWRWRPADKNGHGTLAQVKVAESSTWGADILGIGTYVANFDAALYNLYVVDPSEQQIVRYTMLADGTGFPAAGTGYFTTTRDVSHVTSMFIDGEVFLADGGTVERFTSGQAGSWALQDLPDGILRAGSRYTLITSPDPRREGLIYAFDAAHDRVVAFDKQTGAYRAQYRIAGGGSDWADMRGFYVVPRVAGQAPAIYWIAKDRLGTTTLEEASTAPASPSASPSPASPPDGSPKATPRATRTSRPTP